MHSIREIGEGCKRLYERLFERAWGAATRIPKDALVLAVLILASLASYGLGYLTGRDAQAGTVSIEIAPAAGAAGPASAQSSYGEVQQGSGAYVASKNGTKYYLSSCASANRISDANKVWFASAEAARAAGYAPAANCPGL